MKWLTVNILILFFLLSEASATYFAKEKNLGNFFTDLDKDLTGLNHQVAELAWESMIKPSNIQNQVDLENVANERLKFISNKCKLKWNNKLFGSQMRIFELLCTGLNFDDPVDQRNLLEVSSQIQYVYTTTKICIPHDIDICSDAVNLWNQTYVKFDGIVKKLLFEDGEINFFEVDTQKCSRLSCYSGEPQLEKLMDNDHSAIPNLHTKDCRKNKNMIDYWIWETWRHAIGPNIRQLYPNLINLMNNGAVKAGYSDIGKMWQYEMEIDEVESLMRDLLDEIQPFYNMLHAFVKSLLEKHFKSIDKRSLNIPAHLLGWNANWYHLLKDYIEPAIFTDKWNIDDALELRKWKSSDVVRKIEDFYTSFGLGRLSDDFWSKSYISNDLDTSCHGTAANMFNGNDFRVAVCGTKTLYDLYVITHELGHIQQYMMAQSSLAPFKSGNTVIQETIGDAVFLGFITPMHLNRLQLIDDSKLFPHNHDKNANKNFELHQLLTTALLKVPEAVFGYVFEMFRYDLFAQRIDMENSNDYFWELTRKIQRLDSPSNINRHKLFDVSAKFHFAANVPYARYFFANILQYQVFRGLCEITMYGRVKGNETLNMPLHKCDIYGSRRAGKLLNLSFDYNSLIDSFTAHFFHRNSLKDGSEHTFKTILKDITGSEEISAAAMLEYYQPLIEWLKSYLSANNISY